jgi:hypothetical protein
VSHPDILIPSLQYHRLYNTTVSYFVANYRADFASIQWENECGHLMKDVTPTTRVFDQGDAVANVEDGAW